ncbi:bifunctional 4-hydroxy-2-oxoglutarate aldolase/2-dehydro-3-deoxy-phosphogluconate aldolase [Aliishimia ponticola]|uniref:Bifunctional 4-hydroxy-2-oxoglutarate aldolase/2-dehydro-3-deoxy-phosphogluconate aldolase n=1 Tax=Aliishimia ponticola TaxID=2499833 RepID=A0A4S4NB68_9RHOB|nr:bifunctional 4-hydroxy-2-oxoglutarate aldolase/2-dehydro-3-deoxy-phosphogluconate aldolase [Aliishimia ponticola]THH35925.1 bifunctional 4-hydroxy-2-oxoglutarate aldolase/2-dehydro-3-deoxy-phosphogluconate aldolase [Aliishimia ponticola]
MTPARPLLTGTNVIPVLAFSEVAPTLKMIERMIGAGLKVIELTRRSDVARETLREAKAAFGKDALIGMGTILSPQQLDESIDDGADFGVSPGLTPTLMDAIAKTDFPFLPGTSTVAEAMRAREAGFDVLKFFPAEQAGGAGYLKAMGAVLPDVVFCPTGGVSEKNAHQYLALPNVICVGASALSGPASADPFDAAGFAELIGKFSPPS